MKVAIMQPHYLPWLGYFDLMDRADRFVLLDTVQFSKQGWQQRNRIKTDQGVRFLTVPVLQKMGQLLRDVRIDDRAPWRRKHWSTIEFAYRQAPFWTEFSQPLAQIYERKWEFLWELNAALTLCLKMILKISTPLVFASDFPQETAGRSERLVSICQQLGATLYLSPTGAKAYLQEDGELLTKREIQTEFPNFVHPRYPQMHGEFVSHLSVIDLIFNTGPESLEMIRSQRLMREAIP